MVGNDMDKELINAINDWKKNAEDTKKQIMSDLDALQQRKLELVKELGLQKRWVERLTRLKKREMEHDTGRSGEEIWKEVYFILELSEQCSKYANTRS